MNKPKFTIKNLMNQTSRTGQYMSDFVTDSIFKDICYRLTGQNDYTAEFTNSRNVGRLITLEHDNHTYFISLSLLIPEGRDSAVQTVAPAFNIYYQSDISNKSMHYYFLGAGSGFETPYFMAAYRQMATIGINFINPEVLSVQIHPFVSIDDLISSRKINSTKNSSNNSSYIIKDKSKEIEIYGKTYGANKYAAAMLGYTASVLAKLQGQHITFYEVIERNLKHMPKSCAKTLKRMGNVTLVSTDIELDKHECQAKDNLRSPLYNVHLLDRVGSKHCALCHCEIQEIIQGAHVWPVSLIKKQPLSFDDKFNHAINGENGIWLCQNHHKLFDENIIRFDNHGKVNFHANDEHSIQFLEKITEEHTLPKIYLTEGFFKYLELRNNAI